MRFNSQERLEAWRKDRFFPGIHDDIFQLVATEVTGRSFLDLCCSTGLLGQRIQTKLRASAVGVDTDNKALLRGLSAGIQIPLLHLKIGPSTLGDFSRILSKHAVTAMVARRCISELAVLGPDFMRDFSETLIREGVKELVLEGRAIVPKPTHPFPTIQHEIAAIGPLWRVDSRYRQCAYLVVA